MSKPTLHEAVNAMRQALELFPEKPPSKASPKEIGDYLDIHLKLIKLLERATKLQEGLRRKGIA